MDSANHLVKYINSLDDISTYTYNGDGDRIKMTIDIKNGPDGRGNSKGNGNGNNNGNSDPNCHSAPPGFVPPGLAKKCGYEEEPFPDNQKGGPRDGWEPQFKKKQWEFRYINDVSLDLPEPIQVTEADPTQGTKPLSMDIHTNA